MADIQDMPAAPTAPAAPIQDAPPAPTLPAAPIQDAPPAPTVPAAPALTPDEQAGQAMLSTAPSTPDEVAGAKLLQTGLPKTGQLTPDEQAGQQHIDTILGNAVNMDRGQLMDLYNQNKQMFVGKNLDKLVDLFDAKSMVPSVKDVVEGTEKLPGVVADLGKIVGKLAVEAHTLTPDEYDYVKHVGATEGGGFTAIRDALSGVATTKVAHVADAVENLGTQIDGIFERAFKAGQNIDRKGMEIAGKLLGQKMGLTPEQSQQAIQPKLDMVFGQKDPLKSFLDAASVREMEGQVAIGQGQVAKALGYSSEDLAKEGIKIDPEVIAGYTQAGWLAIPMGGGLKVAKGVEGFAVTTAAGRTIATAGSEAAAKTLVQRIAGAVQTGSAKAGAVVAKAPVTPAGLVSAIGKTDIGAGGAGVAAYELLKHAGVLGSVAAPAAEAYVGIVAGKLAARLGLKIVEVGAKLAGKKAVQPIIKGGVAGGAGMAPIAVFGSDSPSDEVTQMELGIGAGAAGAGLAKLPEAAQLAAQKVHSSIWKDMQPNPAQRTKLAIADQTKLEAENQKTMDLADKSHPEQATIFNALRAATSTQQPVYAMSREFAEALSPELKGKAGAVDLTVPDDTGKQTKVTAVIYDPKGGFEAGAHEPGHLVDRFIQADPKLAEVRQKFLASIPPEVKQAFIQEYVRRGGPDTANVDNEIMAEVFGQYLSGKTMTPGIKTPALSVMASRVLDKLGLYKSTIAQGAPGASAGFGIFPNFSSGKLADQLVSEFLKHPEVKAAFEESQKPPVSPPGETPILGETSKVVPEPTLPVIDPEDLEAIRGVQKKLPGALSRDLEKMIGKVKAGQTLEPREIQLWKDIVGKEPPKVPAPEEIKPVTPEPKVTEEPKAKEEPEKTVRGKGKKVEKLFGARAQAEAETKAANEAVQSSPDFTAEQKAAAASFAAHPQEPHDIVHSAVIEARGEGEAARHAATRGGFSGKVGPEGRSLVNRIGSVVKRMFLTSGGIPQLEVFDAETLVANKEKFDATLAEAGKKVPYANDAEFAEGVRTYLENQNNGHRGGGGKLVRPANVEGVPEPVGEGKPLAPGDAKLNEERENYINALMGEAPPRTARAVPGTTPVQVSAAEIQKVNLGKPVTEIQPAKEFKDYPGHTIKEFNPLRAEVGRGDLEPVSRRMNLADIKSAVHRPDLNLKPNVTRTTAAGFMPARSPIEVESPTGEKYKATFDGLQDFGPAGKIPQITMDEDIPGSRFIKGGTTYSTSLEEAGFKLPTELSAGKNAKFMPSRNYAEASARSGNPYVRRGANDELDADPSNKGRQLLMQFSSDLLYKSQHQADLPSEYYDKLYSGTRPGYARMADFWEIPQWQGFASYFLPKADLYVVRDMAEAKEFLRNAGYDRAMFSALDVNKSLIQELAHDVPEQHMDVGGYTDPKAFDGIDNIKWHDSMESFAKDVGADYRQGVDYRHYEGSDVIPRLTMSKGCKHKCAFCTIEKTVVPTPDAVVDQQADAIAKLGSSLVYLNDKTFGQSANYTRLADLNARIHEINPKFKGFIVQTTASQMTRFDPAWLKKSGIRYVELGIESYNDPILKEMHKPATQAVMDKAVNAIRDAGIAFVPNIVIGFPGETAETYANTMNFLKKNADVISHANIYNLALYKNTELGKKLTTATEDDFNENVLEKSFHEDPGIHAQFAGDLYGYGKWLLDQRPGVTQFMPSTDPRGIRMAAVRTKDGRLFTGPWHVPAIQEYLRDAHPNWDDAQNISAAVGLLGHPSSPLEEGFVTNSGEFLNRAQSYARAVQLQQYVPTNYDKLHKVDELESTDFNHQQLGLPKIEAYGGPGSQFMPSDIRGKGEREENAPVWYSQLSRVVDAKMPNAASSKQLLAMLTNPQNGVKADELKWSGLDDYLKDKENVTKAEVQKYLAANNLKLTEVTKGDAGYSVQELAELKARLAELESQAAPFTDTGEDAPADIREAWTDTAHAIQRLESHSNIDTKYERWQLPGGSNYREFLFQLPSVDSNFFVRLNREETQYGKGAPIYDLVDRRNGLVRFTGDAGAVDAYRNEEFQMGREKGFRSRHWDEPNVIAHTRTNDRVDTTGSSGKFIEEIQSDWHQQGRKKGYSGEPPKATPVVDPGELQMTQEELQWIGVAPDGRHLSVGRGVVKTEKAARDYIAGYMNENARVDNMERLKEFREKVPDAPFKTTWHEMVFRRMVRMAAEEGKNWLGWTTGEQQAERYDLSKVVSEIQYYPATKELIAYDTSKDAKEVLNKKVEPEAVADYIGKDAAEKLLKTKVESPDGFNGPCHSLQAGDLKVGGEGMKGFYDKILVDYANKFGKKFGAKVEDRQIDQQHDSSAAELQTTRERAIQTLDGGGEIYGVFKGVAGEQLIKSYQELIDAEKENDTPLSHWYLGDKQPPATVHSLPITPEMKESVLTKGVSQFMPSKLTGWITPDGKFSELKHNTHEEDLRANAADYNKRFGTKIPVVGPPVIEDRNQAVAKGFMRLRYSPNSGLLVAEGSANNWDSNRKGLLRTLLSNLSRLDNLRINLLGRNGAIVSGDEEQLFRSADKEQAVRDMVQGIRTPGQETSTPEPTAIQRARARPTPEPTEFMPFRPERGQAGPAIKEFQSEDTLEDALRQRGWAVVTGTRESVGPATHPDNIAANEQLKKYLSDNGFKYLPVSDQYKGVDQGESFLVSPISPSKAVEIGKLFGQESVLVPHGLLYADGSLVPATGKIAVGPEAAKSDFYTQIKGGPPFSLDLDFSKRSEQPVPPATGIVPLRKGLEFQPEEERTSFMPAQQSDFFAKSIPSEETDVRKLTPAQITRRFPEAIKPELTESGAKSKVPYNFEAAPLVRGMKTEDAKVEEYAKALTSDARKWWADPTFQDGLRWYHEFTPKLKKWFGKHAGLFAELLAATSPRTNPTVNFGYAVKAYEGWLRGEYDPQINKFNEGLDKIADGSIDEWYRANVPKENQVAEPTESDYFGQWLGAHELLPTQWGRFSPMGIPLDVKFEMHGERILQVLARRWNDTNKGPKVVQFVKNLTGADHNATIDVWAARTLRRLGYDVGGKRWRIMPEMEGGVSENDFAFGQKVFAKAAEKLGITPDALQGGMWFAEKKNWANHGWGRLDLGDFRNELENFISARKLEQAQGKLGESPVDLNQIQQQTRPQAPEDIKPVSAKTRELFGEQKPQFMPIKDSKLTVIRHGETDLNAAGKTRAWRNVPLNEKGREQAEKVGEQLKDSGIEHIVTSDLDRAKETADIIAKKIDAHVVVDPGLRPWGFGTKLEGVKSEVAAPELKKLVHNPDERPEGDYADQPAETFNEYKQRLFSTIGKIQAEYPAGKTAIVTHYRTFRALESRKNGYDIDADHFAQKGKDDTAEVAVLSNGRLSTESGPDIQPANTKPLDINSFGV